jgi:hypothetical protein
VAIDGPQSIALLVPQPGQKTSSHGVLASAARIVGDHSPSTRVSWAYVTCTLQQSHPTMVSKQVAKLPRLLRRDD